MDTSGKNMLCSIFFSVCLLLLLFEFWCWQQLLWVVKAVCIVAMCVFSSSEVELFRTFSKPTRDSKGIFPTVSQLPVIVLATCILYCYKIYCFKYEDNNELTQRHPLISPYKTLYLFLSKALSTVVAYFSTLFQRTCNNKFASNLWLQDSKNWVGKGNNSNRTWPLAK